MLAEGGVPQGVAESVLHGGSLSAMGFAVVRFLEWDTMVAAGRRLVGLEEFVFVTVRRMRWARTVTA